MSIQSSVAFWTSLLAVPAVTFAGKPIFVQSDEPFGNGQATLAVKLADFDGDGDLDAITPTYVGPAFVWINAGDATFTEGQAVGTIAGTTIEVGDLDGDGDIDVFVPSITSGFSQAFLNDGLANFIGTGQVLPHFSTGSASGDIDNDGDLDIFAGTLGGWTNSTITNDGSAQFLPNGGLNGLAARGVALGDLDGDNDLDAFLAVGEGASGVSLNDGTGQFLHTGQPIDAAAFSDHVALADLDGDGDLDAFLGNTDLVVNTVEDTVWLNNGRGSFTDTGQRLGIAGTTHVALGDIDGDGDIDAVTAQPFAPNSVWLNDGNAQFTLAQSLGGLLNQDVQLALGDLDGDGDLDLFVIGGGAGETVWLNQTNCAGDVNGDGVVDVEDLVTLIVAWGTDAPNADIDGSGEVGVGDLVALILTWGDCG